MNKKPIDYKQYDKHWAAVPYNGPGERDKTISSSGCGPTCAAMCIATLKDARVTPAVTCEWSMKHGFKYANQGTAYGYFKPQLAAYGIECKQLLGSRIINKPSHPVHDQVKEYLAQGYWVIALMGTKSRTQRGFWTSGGHYILVWDWDDKVRILDPISSSSKRANGDPDTFRNEARQYWLVDAREYNGKGVDDMTADEVRKIAGEEAAKAAPTVYHMLADVPKWYAPTVKKLMDKGALKGTGGGALDLSGDLCRTLTVLDRLGKLD